MWQEEHFGSGGGILNAVVLPLFLSRTLLGSFLRGYITRNIWNKSMFSSRTGGRRKYFHRFQCRHHACSQHRHLIAVHLLGCLCWYGEISLLLTAPGNLKDTEAASCWQPHCVFLQSSSVFCLLGDVDGWKKTSLPLVRRRSWWHPLFLSNAQIWEKMTRQARMRFLCSCICGIARPEIEIQLRVFAEMRTFWMISQRSSQGSWLELGQVKSYTRSALSKTIFSAFSRWNKQEQESLKKEAKVLPVWRTNCEKLPSPGADVLSSGITFVNHVFTK